MKRILFGMFALIILGAFVVNMPQNVQAQGNNGTVKVEGVVWDNIPNNAPHQSCIFNIEWWNFDDATNDTAVSFTGQAPTGKDVPLANDTFTFTGGQGFNVRKVYDLTFALQSIAPQPQQGWHISLDIHTTYSNGADIKQKTFWLTGCVPTPTPTSTPTFTATPTDTATFTNTPTSTSTDIPTASNTPTSTQTPTASDTPTDTTTSTPTDTPTATLTKVPPSSTPTFTPTPSSTVVIPTAAPTDTPTPTDRTVPSTATDTATFTPTATQTSTYTPVPVSCDKTKVKRFANNPYKIQITVFGTGPVTGYGINIKKRYLGPQESNVFIIKLSTNMISTMIRGWVFDVNNQRFSSHNCKIPLQVVTLTPTATRTKIPTRTPTPAPTNTPKPQDPNVGVTLDYTVDTGSISFVVGVQNYNGKNTAKGLKFQLDPLPSNMNYISGGEKCSFDSATRVVTCRRKKLLPSAYAEWRFKTTKPADGFGLCGKLTTRSYDGKPLNNTACVSYPLPQPEPTATPYPGP